MNTIDALRRILGTVPDTLTKQAAEHEDRAGACWAAMSAEHRALVLGALHDRGLLDARAIGYALALTATGDDERIKPLGDVLTDAVAATLDAASDPGGTFLLPLDLLDVLERDGAKGAHVGSGRALARWVFGHPGTTAGHLTSVYQAALKDAKGRAGALRGDEKKARHAEIEAQLLRLLDHAAVPLVDPPDDDRTWTDEEIDSFVQVETDENVIRWRWSPGTPPEIVADGPPDWDRVSRSEALAGMDLHDDYKLARRLSQAGDLWVQIFGDNVGMVNRPGWTPNDPRFNGADYRASVYRASEAAANQSVATFLLQTAAWDFPTKPYASYAMLWGSEIGWRNLAGLISPDGPWTVWCAPESTRGRLWEAAVDVVTRRAEEDEAKAQADEERRQREAEQKRAEEQERHLQTAPVAEIAPGFLRATVGETKITVRLTDDAPDRLREGPLSGLAALSRGLSVADREALRLAVAKGLPVEADGVLTWTATTAERAALVASALDEARQARDAARAAHEAAQEAQRAEEARQRAERDAELRAARESQDARTAAQRHAAARQILEAL